MAARELTALSEGRFDELEELIRQAAVIQRELDKHFSVRALSDCSPEVTRNLREIHAMQANILKEMQHGYDLLSERIGTLRRNRSSLAGYKQHKGSSPRFFNRHT